MTVREWVTNNNIIQSYSNYPFFDGDKRITVENILKFSYGKRELAFDESEIKDVIKTLFDTMSYSWTKLYESTQHIYSPFERYNVVTKEKENTITKTDTANTGTVRNDISGGGTSYNTTTNTGYDTASDSHNVNGTRKGNNEEHATVNEKRTAESDITSKNDSKTTSDTTTTNSKRTYENEAMLDTDTAKGQNKSTAEGTGESHQKDTNNGDVKDDKTMKIDETNTEKGDSTKRTDYNSGTRSDITTSNNGQNTETRNLSQTGNVNGDATREQTVSGIQNIDYESIIMREREVAQFSFLNVIAKTIADNISLMSYNL